MARPVFQQVVTGAALGPLAASVVSAILAAAPNHLYLAYIFTDAAAGAPAVTGVTGLGLTWTLVKAQCSGQDEHRVEVWMAVGTADVSAGAVTATFVGADGACIAVERWSGVSPTDPIGASAGYNTNGSGGACSGGVDTDDATGSITTTLPGSVVVMGIAHDEVFSHTAGWTARVTNESSGASLSASVEDKAVTAAGAVTVGAASNLAGADDWALVAVEIMAGARPAAPRALARFYDPGTGRPLRDVVAWQ